MRRVPMPAAPAGLDSDKARRERADALAFYAHWDGEAKFEFDAYKATDVRPALEAAFGGKCAYCETYYAATQPVAIEHYRPKGGVIIGDGGRPTPPGYYWLASEWTNLLPSCTDCNSPRGQDLPGEHRTAGKANAFPLASEGTRAHAPGEEAREERLLVHPYWDHPEKHFRFVWGTDSISDGWVEPARSPSGRVSAKGRATIAVCALQRRGLVKARRELLESLVGHLESVVEARDNAVAHPDDPRFPEQFARRAREVARFVEDHAPYSVMARQVVAAYHDRLFGPKE
ncbi:HNH endonuclease family protein [Tessaracoccus terricola]